MTIKSILTGLLTSVAIGACLVPILAQEPDDSGSRASKSRRNDPAGIAQRQRADLYAAAQNAAASQAPHYPGAPGAFGLNGSLGQSNPLMSSQLAVPGNFAGATFGGPSAFDPALAKAINESNTEVAKLMKQLKETEADAEKETIKEKIKTELDLQYDAYLDHHEQPLKQLEERLAKLRDEFEARKKAKDDLVKLRLDTIWYDAQGLGWPSNRTTTLWSNSNFTVQAQDPLGYNPTPATGLIPPASQLPPIPPAPPAPGSGPAR